VRLVFLSNLHQERVKPGREVTIDFRGCRPANAVAERDDRILMTFRKLPKGTFYMGGVGGKPGIKTPIREDFEIAAHDVTQGQWEAIMGNNPSWFARTGGGAGHVRNVPDEELRLFPVESVSWEDAQEFLRKLNEKERGRGYWYRLPTEAEWEYACRAGATSAEDCSYDFYLEKPSHDLSSNQANFNGVFPFGHAPKGPSLPRPSRVGAYPPNQLGLCDMHGNVWQWTESKANLTRIYRGGCWAVDGSSCRASIRSAMMPTVRNYYTGFRLVRVPVRTEAEARKATEPLELGRACAARRDWAQAVDGYARALKRDPISDGYFWFEYAALLLLAGDRTGYLKTCAHLSERCGKTVNSRPYHVARACTLTPDGLVEVSLPGRLVQQELQASAQEFWSLTEQGALEYRAGQFQNGVDCFERSLRADPRPGRAVLNWLWLALANQRLGRAAEARRWLGKAREWLDQYADGMPARAEQEFGLHYHNWLEAHVLRQEAEALIQPTDP
jgi:formylglycine-generating enzyme required for sulfatase activity